VAVFTPVSPDQAAAFLRAYDLGGLVGLEGVEEGVENTNYRLETDRGVFALTLFEKRVNPADLPFYLGLMEHLADRAAPVPRPRRDRMGRLRGDLNGRAAVLVDWLPGAWLRAPGLPDHTAAGEALARLHAAADGFPFGRPNDLSVEGWGALAQGCEGRARGEHAAMLEALEQEIAWLAARWPADLPSGPIHADYFPDNVLFEDGGVSGIIDHYFACTDSLAYDLAIALNAWGFDREGRADAAALSAFRSGYEAVRPLEPEEQRALPLLCRGAAVRFTLSRLHDWLHHDTSWRVTPKDPAPFFRRLRWFQAGGDQPW
jgi:homoserine kinase type II